MERLIRLMDDIEDFIVATRFRLRRLLSPRPRERRSYPRERRVSSPDTPYYPERRRASRA